ncbi:MAG: hypothetical protein MK212_01220 [Saprospiraceae bacterium]|nr:hypothetical protein [Saprospiraceae bacterium]
MQTKFFTFFLFCFCLSSTLSAQWKMHYEQNYDLDIYLDKSYTPFGQSAKQHHLHIDSKKYFSELFVCLGDSIYLLNTCQLSTPEQKANLENYCPLYNTDHKLRKATACCPVYKTASSDIPLDSCEFETAYYRVYVWYHSGYSEGPCIEGALMYEVNEKLGYHISIYKVDQSISYDPQKTKFNVETNAIYIPYKYWIKPQHLPQDSSVSTSAITWDRRSFEHVLPDNLYAYPKQFNRWYPNRRGVQLNIHEQTGDFHKSLDHYFDYLMQHPNKIHFPNDTVLGHTEKLHYALGRFYIRGLGHFDSNPLRSKEIIGIEVQQDWFWDDEAKQLFIRPKSLCFLRRDPKPPHQRTVLFCVDYED